MTEQVRNIAVGVTVIIALSLLGGMILLFTGLPWIAQRGYVIYIRSDTTHDAHVNDPIHISGLRKGMVAGIDFTDPKRPQDGVTFTVLIDRAIRLPGNTRAYFFTRGLVGSAYIELKSMGPALTDPSTGEELEYYPTDGSVIMPSVHVGTGAFPKELTEALKGMSKLAENLNELIAPTVSETQPTEGIAAPEAIGIKGTINKLNKALDALTNFADKTAQAATQAKITAGDYSDLARKLMIDAEEISQLISTVNRIMVKVESGKGTAGKLMNDPELYNKLLDVTGQLSSLMTEFRGLLDQWKKTGVDLNLHLTTGESSKKDN